MAGWIRIQNDNFILYYDIMFKLYIIKAQNLTKGESYNIVVDHIALDKNIYRLGQTGPVKDDRNEWKYDLDHRRLFFYPFTDSDDSSILLTVIKGKNFKKSIGTASFKLSDVKFGQDHEVVIESSTEGKAVNSPPQVIIFAETFFGDIYKRIKSGDKSNLIKNDMEDLKLLKYSYLYVYLENPPNVIGGASVELQIYECTCSDGGYSNLIGKTTSKGKIIKKQIFQNPFTPNGCTQLFYFNASEIEPQFRYVPLIRINRNPGTFLVTYALFTFQSIPSLTQNKEGFFDFGGSMNPIEPRIIYQDSVNCPNEDLFTGYTCFFFSEGIFQKTQILQLQKGYDHIDDFALKLRTRCFPKIPGLFAFKRFTMDPNKLYTIKDICDFHNRKHPQALRFILSWESSADLDLSICALNKNLDCVGHVSFKDHVFFNHNSLEHLDPFRNDIPEKGGNESVVIKLFEIPQQVKTILIVATCYNDVPFMKIVPNFKMFDSVDRFELLNFELKSIKDDKGILFAAMKRAPHHQWYFIPLLYYVDENKPYNAHRVLIEKLKENNFIADFIQSHNNPPGKKD